MLSHTVTSSEFEDSGTLNSGEICHHTFTEAGEFLYACTFHPTMKGTIIVR